MDKKYVNNFTKFLSRMNQDAGTNGRIQNLAWEIWEQSRDNAKDPNKPGMADCLKDLERQIDEAHEENPQGGIDEFLKKTWTEARKELEESMFDNENRFDKYFIKNRP